MGGTRSRCFNSGYHDLELLIIISCLCTYVQVGYYSNAKDVLQIYH